MAGPALKRLMAEYKGTYNSTFNTCVIHFADLYERKVVETNSVATKRLQKIGFGGRFNNTNCYEFSFFAPAFLFCTLARLTKEPTRRHPGGTSE